MNYSTNVLGRLKPLKPLCPGAKAFWFYGLRYKPGSSFDMFGASLVGPESDVFGNSGAMCSLALNMWPSAKEISDVNIYEPHEYEVRIHWVDGEKKCQMEIPPFSPLEVQIWSDGYLLKTSPWWKLGIPQIGFQTGNKWFAFDYVDVVSE